MINSMKTFILESKLPLVFIGQLPDDRILDGMLFILPGEMRSFEEEKVFPMFIKLIGEFKKRMTTTASFVIIIEDVDKNASKGWLIKFYGMLFSLWGKGTLHEYVFKDKKVDVFWGQDVNTVHGVPKHITKDVSYDQQNFIKFWVSHVTKEGDSIIDPFSYYGHVAMVGIKERRFMLVNEIVSDLVPGVMSVLTLLEEEIVP